jgi:hypothetical protein
MRLFKVVVFPAFLLVPTTAVTLTGLVFTTDTLASTEGHAFYSSGWFESKSK